MNGTDDMKDLIHREIQSISGLAERVAFKDMMEGVFLALYEKNEEMYRNLERRVMDDLAYNINQYRIRTGLVERRYLDLSHHLMAPVCQEDAQTVRYKTGEIRRGVQEGGFCITTAFLEGDVLDIETMMKDGKTCAGILRTDRDWPVTVRLEPARRYLEQMEHLYHLFMKNGIPWRTVNAPYLFKMMDVVIVDLPDEAGDQETAVGIDVDFGKYNRMVRYDMVPVWNVRRLVLEGTGFPIACGDHENYEHVVSIGDYGTEHAYLVEEKAGIRSVRQNGDRLLITGQVASAKKWEIYTIRSGGDYKIDRYTYPVMENLRKDGFAERFQRRNGQRVKTRGELERFVRGFGLESYIAYQDCELEEAGSRKPETYSMNFFMRDEIRDQKGRRRLVLHFKARGKETWLLRDIASFIVSEVQELYPEYQCEGRVDELSVGSVSEGETAGE